MEELPPREEPEELPTARSVRARRAVQRALEARKSAMEALRKPDGRRAFLRSVGYSVPDRVVTNHDLVGRIETTHEFVKTRTGILERRHVDHPTATSHLMIAAAEQAIE